MFRNMALGIVFIGSTWGFSAEIPRKIHYIWLGDEISEQYIDNIKNFADANKNYEVKVWTNQKALFLKLPASRNIKIEDIEQLYSQMSLPLLDYLNHEMLEGTYKNLANLSPNYAAASDILRIQILKHEGGIYLDTDVSIKKSSFRRAGQLPTIKAALGFVVPVVVKESASGYDIKYNNYMFGSVKGHYVLGLIEQNIEQNYRKFLVAPEQAQEKEFNASKYGITRSENEILVVKAALSTQNFWENKLTRGAILRYVLTHETTGLGVLEPLLLDEEILRNSYKTYSPGAKDHQKIEEIELINKIKFPAVDNFVHENQLLWWKAKSTST